jgi:hypothetical protein
MPQVVAFEMVSQYHMPIGFSRKGTTEFVFVSVCRRWHARRGNFGTMILTDRHTNTVHVVKGKMPEVKEFVRCL